ncbi:MAG: hypothetical protein KDD06_15590 [Phaeodactylibacter sp.]|nr:hypothetical protein [Phaeodactylibacter sp.]MCB9264705.1 hypothetical protein [Lewinellaceae bacterium]MCB9287085.1 hypothetical protein [Lewinellaceae bacterium]
MDTKTTEKLSSSGRNYRSVSREFALAMAFWLALLLFGAAWLGLLQPRRLSFFCSAEEVVQRNAAPALKGKGALFTGARRRTRKVAFEGSYSLAIYPDNPFGFEFKVPNLKGTEQLELEVWRYVEKGDPASGHIVAEVPGLMWQSCNEVAEIKDNGWQRLYCTMEVPANSRNRELKVYCWINGPNPVYFDNIRVNVWRRFPQ